MSDLFFASSNRHKFEEAREILAQFGLRLRFFRYSLEEIQSEDLSEIARHKALQACMQCPGPVIVEDAGLFIDSLNGFPGPYSSFVFDTIGNRGILKLVSSKRAATFRSIIAYCEKNHDVMVFEARVKGKISRKLQGRRWGFDPIFIPEGRSKTYSQISDKNSVSHRFRALEKFASWYLRRLQSTG
ncbi:MAG TPA: RdgB/HAM1 family non-canonical purine NTP pyrophosphatase [Candidatus Nitrosotalea sp.]|nr:RdgB/HAM1 family non-canonical purine NTP pyrophosphatase [Candidatus Nitrosotalea sp.]